MRIASELERLIVYFKNKSYWCDPDHNGEGVRAVDLDLVTKSLQDLIIAIHRGTMDTESDYD